MNRSSLYPPVFYPPFFYPPFVSFLILFSLPSSSLRSLFLSSLSSFTLLSTPFLHTHSSLLRSPAACRGHLLSHLCIQAMETRWRKEANTLRAPSAARHLPPSCAIPGTTGQSDIAQRFRWAGRNGVERVRAMLVECWCREGLTARQRKY